MSDQNMKTKSVNEKVISPAVIKRLPRYYRYLGDGYNVEYLYSEMGKILGLDRDNNIIIIGAGNLGQALANNQDFDSNGFKIIGIFDVNPKLIGMTVKGVEVYDIDMLKDFIAHHDVRIAALTLPKSKAPVIARELCDLGIRAFWNFAPVDLSLSEDVIVENVHLSESIMTLSYRIHSKNQ